MPVAPPRPNPSAPWLADGYPGHMPIPTMLAREEIDYLHWLAARRFTGEGRICELGPFLGGSTMALCEGMAANPSAGTKLITYDAFVMDAASAAAFPTGRAAGESFRPVFEAYLRPHLHRITIREGWLPPDLSREGERELYPEQAPIEILFVDAAKSWPVSNTILAAFGRHLIPGRSVLVQQDFKHFGAYWLALHMHQLAPCFRPLHDVHDAPTLSFLYTGDDGGIEPRLAGLWRADDIPPQRIGRAWDAVEAQWAGAPGVLPLLRLGRSLHLVRCGLAPDALAILEHAAGQLRPHPHGPPPLPARELAGCIAHILRKNLVKDAEHLRRLHDLRDRTAAGAGAQARRSRQRLAVLDRCERRGWSRIALFGAGRHTVELLGSGWPFGRLRIAAIADDYSSARSVAGIPVVRPQALPPPIDAVIVSSEASQEALAQAAEHALAGRGLPILRMYVE